MTAWYNENDAYAARWLRELIREGLIADGEVEERSIVDVRPVDLRGFTQCHLFAGIGVWSYALRLAGWPDDRPVWTGSCPCQPFSAAGKGGGFDDERHLWPAFHWLIQHGAPDVVFGEQVASADGLAWLDLVQADLAGAGYASGAIDLCAAGLRSTSGKGSGGSLKAGRRRTPATVPGGGQNLRYPTPPPCWRAGTPAARDQKDTTGMATEAVNPDGSVRNRLISCETGGAGGWPDADGAGRQSGTG
jgi:hypothetical protein